MIIGIIIACARPEGAKQTTGPEALPTHERDAADTGSVGELVEVEMSAMLTTAWRQTDLDSDEIVTDEQEVEGARFLITPDEGQKLTDEEPEGVVVSGSTPSTVSLPPGQYCARFYYQSDVDTSYMSDAWCFDTAQQTSVSGKLCVELYSDWVCEDMWGEWSEQIYTNRDIEMDGCSVELVGITWGGKSAEVDGHYISFELGEYAAEGAIDEMGTSIEWFMDWPPDYLDYWTTCQMMY